MISVINPDKITRQLFFQELINYLWTHTDVTLRELKKHFSDILKLDRQLEDYIQAGYINRQERRYSLSLSLLENSRAVHLDEMIFVDDCSPAYQELQGLRYQTELANQTNDLVIVEETNFKRQQLTLSNYFYRLAHAYPLSSEQEKLYRLLGDVNQEYALKYMTTFLLKFTRKDVVKQKRPDIFVQALVLLGYLEPVDDVSYRCLLSIDSNQLRFSAV